MKSYQLKQAFYSICAQVLSLWNLTIPAVSIVMQGILKVSDNRHHADHGVFEDAGGINYEDFDLDECARSFRQGSVAVFTISAIVLQALTKTFQPDRKAGNFDEKIAKLKGQLDEFEKGLLQVGSGRDATDGKSSGE